MSNIDQILGAPAPRTIKDALAQWPEREQWTPSPADWRDEVFYFLLPDRFSDGNETDANRLGADLSTAAGVQEIKALRGGDWKWKDWQTSGGQRFQGGTLNGIQSKLGYLQELGITTLWIGPIFRQRVEDNTYHGYGFQNFLEIDPRFGSARDLVNLVAEAHKRNLRVVLDVIMNHTGCNWLYDASAGDMRQPPYRAVGGYDPTWARSGLGSPIYDRNQALGADDFVWPTELQDRANYIGAGSGNLGNGDIDDPNAEFRRTDFCDLRKLNLFRDDTLGTLVLAFQYWIALADLDGFRIDTFKHVTEDQARNFCNAIKEHASVLGKNDFFLVAEVAGGNDAEGHYLSITGRNLNACLDIGEQRDTIVRVSKGLSRGMDFFAGFNFFDPMGSHRNWGSMHLSISNDHDHVFGPKVRLAADASNDHQGTVAIAIQLFTLGIPCIYYGTEQGLASGAEPEERQWLDGWGTTDTYLREAMFGPVHPRASGWTGTQGRLDTGLPGFGPHGTAGKHVFDPSHPVYNRMAQLATIRRRFMPLRKGRQYPREISILSYPFAMPNTGEIVAWSRVFDDQEVLVVVNPHGTDRRGGRVVVDSRISSTGLDVVANTERVPGGALTPGSHLPLQSWSGWTYVDLADTLGPSEVVVLANASAIEASKR
jgi:glycosidase